MLDAPTFDLFRLILNRVWHYAPAKGFLPAEIISGPAGQVTFSETGSLCPTGFFNAAKILVATIQPVIAQIISAPMTRTISYGLSERSHWGSKNAQDPMKNATVPKNTAPNRRTRSRLDSM